ncbi:MAG: amidohydrolase family protein [Acidimicrobiales bacterium]|jgi:predicted TIM-barrel fold metal-dependent hydrolase
MPVIDVDHHLESDVSLVVDFCKQVGGSMPHCPELKAMMFAGDLLRALPPDRRPRGEELYPQKPGAKPWGPDSAVKNPAPAAFEAAARVEWLDEWGIDQAFVNFGATNGGAGALLTEVADLQRLSSLTNDFIAERLEGHTDRLLQVAVIKDASDVKWTVKELARMRARGCRGFSVSTRPVNDRSLAHPSWNPIWSAATDLGMIYVMHVGFTPSNLDVGAADSGWMLPGGMGAGGLLRFNIAEGHLASQRALTTMVFGGVFTRHPELTVVLEELQVGWLPSLVERLDALTEPFYVRALNEWVSELGAGDILRRNVRATPLALMGDNALDLIRRLPEMIVFSTDFPHVEGNDVIFEPGLNSLADEVRSAFLGDNIAECFVRMGDPLPVIGA